MLSQALTGARAGSVSTATAGEPAREINYRLRRSGHPRHRGQRRRGWSTEPRLGDTGAGGRSPGPAQPRGCSGPGSAGQGMMEQRRSARPGCSSRLPHPSLHPSPAHTTPQGRSVPHLTQSCSLPAQNRSATSEENRSKAQVHLKALPRTAEPLQMGWLQGAPKIPNPLFPYPAAQQRMSLGPPCPRLPPEPGNSQLEGILFQASAPAPSWDQSGSAHSCTPSAKLQLSLLKGTFLN